MAAIRDLIELAEREIGVPYSTARQVAHLLRDSESQWLPKGRRGLAAQIQPEHAVNYLIALLCSNSISEAAVTVREYGDQPLSFVHVRPTGTELGELVAEDGAVSAPADRQQLVGTPLRDTLSAIVEQCRSSEARKRWLTKNSVIKGYRHPVRNMIFEYDAEDGRVALFFWSDGRPADGLLVVASIPGTVLVKIAELLFETDDLAGDHVTQLAEAEKT